MLAGVVEQRVTGALNVGSDGENHTIADIAEAVAGVVPGAVIDRGPEHDEADARDYRVSFAQLQKVLPGACPTPLKDGAREVADLVLAGAVGDPAQDQYDNHRGLVTAVAAGRVGRWGGEDCAQYWADYRAAWGAR
ncbi:hypothetical protein ACFV4P_13310 [Kitasatospora sp. NPDC059795]|uniref:hypothetical protein n=1 Tax=Kitasatospora sp. NPDC059795 TaxID=3346949 RepID=UPI0036616173